MRIVRGNPRRIGTSPEALRTSSAPRMPNCTDPRRYPAARAGGAGRCRACKVGDSALWRADDETQSTQETSVPSHISRDDLRLRMTTTAASDPRRGARRRLLRGRAPPRRHQHPPWPGRPARRCAAARPTGTDRRLLQRHRREQRRRRQAPRRARLRHRRRVRRRQGGLGRTRAARRTARHRPPDDRHHRPGAQGRQQTGASPPPFHELVSTCKTRASEGEQPDRAGARLRAGASLGRSSTRRSARPPGRAEPVARRRRSAWSLPMQARRLRSNVDPAPNDDTHRPDHQLTDALIRRWP